MFTSETYKAVYDSYPDGVILVDYFGIIVLTNQRGSEMFGYEKDELLGYSIETLMPDSYVKAHQRHRSDYLNNPSSKLAKNSRVVAATKKDKSDFLAEISISKLKIGKKNLVAAFVKDVTVRESLEMRFHKMVSEVQDYAMVFLDIHGIVTNSNKGVQRIIGFSEGEILGKHFELFYTAEDIRDEIPEKHLDKAIDNNRMAIEGWRLRKNGSLFWGTVVITTIKDDSGHLIGFSKVVRDLTDKKRAEEELRKHSDALIAKNKELESFAYVASHDLQEPLSTISGMINLIRKESTLKIDDETSSYFTFIEGAIERMRTLIKAFLDYSRLGRNKQLRKVNINNTLQEVLADLGTRIQSVNASITVAPMPELAVYDVEFRLLFQNLISNALKFVAPDTRPEIKIDATEYGNYWKFSVQDNGIGIDSAHQNAIFILFQRLNKQTAFPGDGIGLAHCKKIVELHHGTIWVKSEKGKGSEFNFTIPKGLKDEIEGVEEGNSSATGF